tara:strand:+ start:386 stop:532 length:147 start_codon:yes stop_codon:yes gene_type:complete
MKKLLMVVPIMLLLIVACKSEACKVEEVAPAVEEVIPTEKVVPVETVK